MWKKNRRKDGVERETLLKSRGGEGKNKGSRNNEDNQKDLKTSSSSSRHRSYQKKLWIHMNWPTRIKEGEERSHAAMKKGSAGASASRGGECAKTKRKKNGRGRKCKKKVRKKIPQQIQNSWGEKEAGGTKPKEKIKDEGRGTCPVIKQKAKQMSRSR